jgi:hypothetical protein
MYLDSRRPGQYSNRDTTIIYSVIKMRRIIFIIIIIIIIIITLRACWSVVG